MGFGPLTGTEPTPMRLPLPGSFRDQASVLRRQFLQDGGLPFTDVLTEGVLTGALAAVGGWLDRIFSPLVTLWVFLGQVLSPDHSCRAAVARLVAHRLAHGRRPCSARTGAYCRARERLPEGFFSTAACSVGRGLDAKADRLVVWRKPTSIRSVDRRTYNALPDAITVREARFRVARPGFRTRSVVAVTTLLDPAQATREELAGLYRARWHAELDLRSLKSTMQMGELRGKTPEMVRKEV